MKLYGNIGLTTKKGIMNDYFKGKPAEYYEGLDKRTKEYKQYRRWLKLKKSKNDSKSIEYKHEKGAGDVVDDITTATGIKKAVEKLFGDGCGCEKRRERMNAYPGLSFFTKRRGNELTADEYEFLVEYFEAIKPGFRHDRQQQERLQKIYRRVFNESPTRKFSTCGSCHARMERNLKQVVDYYNQHELK